jgi:integrase
MERLQAYLARRGWRSLSDAPAEAPLLGRAFEGPHGPLPFGLAVDELTGIASGTLYRQVSAFFRLVARRVGEADAPAAARLRRATTHWLRHTFGTHIVGMTKDVVLARDLLGHASVGTTNGYLDGDELERHRAVDRLLQQSVSGLAHPAGGLEPQAA